VNFTWDVIIPSNECVIRAVKRDFHVKQGQLRWKAFVPPKGLSRISVIRYTLGSSLCKQHAREIAGAWYSGIASLPVGDLRREEFGVTDESVGHFLGHAEIDLGVRTPTDDEPDDPIQRKRVKDRCEVILNRARYLSDPNPESENWLGECMCPGGS